MSALDKVLEKVVIQEYLRKHDFFEDTLIKYPDPPDCVFQKKDNKGWLEVTSVYRHFKKFTPTKGQHKPIGTYEYECPINEEIIIKEVILTTIERIISKDSSHTYKDFNVQYGNGTLLIFIYDSCFKWQNQLNTIVDPHYYQHISLKTFESVYIYNHPTTTDLVSSNPLLWETKVLTDHENFHLILKRK